MLYKHFLLILIFFSMVLPLHAEETPKSLVIMLDGARADVMLMAATPNFDSLRNGSWAEGYHGAWSFAAHTIKDASTISAQNHTAIATGATAKKTQVYNNNVYDNYNKSNASATYKNYLTRIKAKFPEKKTVAVFSWEPDKNLVSENNPCDLVITKEDEENAKHVVSILAGSFESETWKKGTDADAILYYIDLPDHIGHSGGYCPPGTKHKEYIACIEEIDGWLDSILDTIRKRPKFSNENWQIIICSDHGGWVSGHGAMRADNYTIPFFISSKTAVQGEICGQPCNADAAVTVLDHFGFDAAEMKKEGLLDGSVRGKNEAAAVSNKPIEEGLLVYLPFDGTLENKAPQISEAITAENHGAKFESTGGKQNGYLALRKGELPQFVTFGNPKPLQWGTDTNFSIAFWTRLPAAQEGDPVFFGNKDWTTGRNSGFCLFANPMLSNNGNIIGLNLANTDNRRVDIKKIFLTANDWWFCAVTANRKGNATLFAGSPDGCLFFVSESLINENIGKSFDRLDGSIDSPQPWNIGQDGTGKCPSQLNADIDEFRIWNRALSLNEIEILFKN